MYFEDNTMWRQRIVDIFFVTLTLLFSVFMIFTWMLNAFDVQFIFAKDDSEQVGTYEINWGIQINANCPEVFYAESNHDARGEGWRYHIYKENSGNTIVQSKPEKKEKISIAQGFGEDNEVDALLSRLYQALDIPEEYHCSTVQNYWIHYQQQDGSSLVIIKTESYFYIAEELL